MCARRMYGTPEEQRRIRKYEQEIAKRAYEEGKKRQENEFLRHSIRNSQKMRALKEQQKQQQMVRVLIFVHHALVSPFEFPALFGGFNSGLFFTTQHAWGQIPCVLMTFSRKRGFFWFFVLCAAMCPQVCKHST